MTTCTRILLLAMFLVFLFPLIGNYATAQTVATKVEDFQLPAQFGKWIQAKAFGGQVWKPNVDARWRPFINGDWLWTNEGWYWNSYEDFGWMLYHYGNWYYDAGLGWYWVPGYTWSPAPVEWMTFDQYVAWAPKPPQGFKVADPWTSSPVTIWSVVAAKDFMRADIAQYLAKTQRPAKQAGVSYKPPDPATLQKATGAPVQQVKLVRTKTGEFEQVQLPEDLEQRTKSHRKPGSFGKAAHGPVSESGKRYIGKSPEDCARMRFTCAKGEKYFSDTTGCGCEPGRHQSQGQ